MGESRSELLQWVNGLVQVNFTKIEQMGTGSAYCQIIDSIFGDVALSKVKFDAKQEYEYVQNFKVLQDAFTRHKIDRAIPVDRLVKCKMQDNLEFSQWLKKYWDSVNPGTAYDAAGRRKGAPGAAAATAATTAAATASTASAPAARAAAPAISPAPRTAPAAAARATPAPAPAAAPAPATAATAAAATATRPAAAAAPLPAAAAPAPAAQAALEAHTAELRLTIDSVEKERDFYFNKLREIEVIVQVRDAAVESGTVLSADAAALVNELKKVLYSTEEGFELPADLPEAGASISAEAPPADPIEDEY